MDFVADVNNEVIYTLDHLGNMLKISMSTAELVASYKLFDEFNYSFSNSDISADGKFIAYGFNDDKLRVFNTEKGEFEFESKAYKTKIISLAIDRDKPIVYVSSHDGDLVLFNYKTKKVVESVTAENSPFRIISVKKRVLV